MLYRRFLDQVVEQVGKLLVPCFNNLSGHGKDLICRSTPRQRAPGYSSRNFQFFTNVLSMSARRCRNSASIASHLLTRTTTLTPSSSVIPATWVSCAVIPSVGINEQQGQVRSL